MNGKLISPEYLAQQKAMHAAPRGYGGKGSKWADEVLQLCGEFGTKSVLDYGCGEGSLAKALRWHSVPVAEYDPAINGKDRLPDPADVVVCTDVLEHIEPDRIDAVLEHLRALTRKACLAAICLRPANKNLPDGRNAHILLRPVGWWRERLEAHGFMVAKELRTDHKLWVVVLE
jgi:2-polyprenyl-3-methyl-5-hydroxy-6-metoxy-1,4-benzoquinol methylase